MDKSVTVYTVAVVVLLICIYAFALSCKLLEGTFESNALGWYFLGKGLFCSLSLVLAERILRRVETMG